ncbi:hypothetical protein OAV62_01655 [bacterium]|nr:hypothetical protein [bacterium]
MSSYTLKKNLLFANTTPTFDPEDYIRSTHTSLGSRDITKTLLKFKTQLRDPKEIAINKVQICNTILLRYYDYIVVSQELKDIIIKELSPCIQDPSVPLTITPTKEVNELYEKMGSEIRKKPDSFSLGYLRSKCIPVVIAVSQYQRKHRQPGFGINPYIQILNVLSRVSDEHKSSCLDELDEMFYDTSNSIMERMNIVDVFMLLDPVRGGRALDSLRNEQQVETTTPRTVYEDPQNVHDHTISETIIEAIVYLCTNFKPTRIINLNDLIRLRPTKRESIVNVFERIAYDTYSFSGFTLSDIVESLWEYISTHRNSTDMKLVLIDEICSMEGYCSSGHMARLIACLQGFDIDHQLRINIGLENEIYAALSHDLKSKLADNDVLMEALVQDPEKFCAIFRDEFAKDFTINHIQSYNLKKCTEMECLVGALSKYTKLSKDVVKTIMDSTDTVDVE